MKRYKAWDKKGAPFLYQDQELDDAWAVVVQVGEAKIEIELFERIPGLLSIRAHDGSLVVHPTVSNAIELGVLEYRITPDAKRGK